MRTCIYWLFAGALILLGACSEKPDHNANWYYYWEKDNVIPGLDRAGSPASRWDWDVDAANAGVYGASHGPSNGYVLTDLCIVNPIQAQFQVTHDSGNPVVWIGATTAFGIEQVAVTMTHEKEHIAIWQQLQIPGQIDTDDDRLADSREGIPPYNLIVGNKDTYDLAGRIHITYADYGDNEFLTRVAEATGLASANLNEDWSEGGAQWRR